jgi:hypothetical protein
MSFCEQLLPNHRFIDTIFKYKSLHYRDGPSLCSLYDVILCIELPRKNLLPGRTFQHVLIDLEQHHLQIYYRNGKSSCIRFDELDSGICMPSIGTKLY